MPRSEQEVVSELAALGCSVNNMQLTALIQSLLDDEVIIAALTVSNSTEITTLLLTSKRVISVIYSKRVWLAPWVDTSYVYLQDVKNVLRGATGYGDLSILVGGINASVIAYYSKESVSEERIIGFIRTIEEKVDKIRSTASSSAYSSSEELLAALERLASLKEKDLITEEEFQQAKQKLLLG